MGYFSSPKHTDWLLGSTQLPSQWVLDSFAGVSVHSVKLNTHSHLVLRLRISGAILLLLPPHHGLERENFNSACT